MYQIFLYLANFHFTMENFKQKSREKGTMNLHLGPITCFNNYHHYVFLVFAPFTTWLVSLCSEQSEISSKNVHQTCCVSSYVCRARPSSISVQQKIHLVAQPKTQLSLILDPSFFLFLTPNFQVLSAVPSP